jgi:hypothetical protein
MWDLDPEQLWMRTNQGFPLRLQVMKYVAQVLDEIIQHANSNIGCMSNYPAPLAGTPAATYEPVANTAQAYERL